LIQLNEKKILKGSVWQAVGISWEIPKSLSFYVFKQRLNREGGIKALEISLDHESSDHDIQEFHERSSSVK
jgi:hypothetical protein